MARRTSSDGRKQSFRFRPGLTPAGETQELSLSEESFGDTLLRLLHEFGIVQPKVCTGLIISGDQFVAGTEAQSKIRQAIPAALCVEMEGAAVAQVCYEHDVPVAVVRAI
jgi:nucleoside phosphorylase